jgi:hypothetical protein
LDEVEEFVNEKRDDNELDSEQVKIKQKGGELTLLGS